MFPVQADSSQKAHQRDQSLRHASLTSLGLALTHIHRAYRRLVFTDRTSSSSNPQSLHANRVQMLACLEQAITELELYVPGQQWRFDDTAFSAADEDDEHLKLMLEDAELGMGMAASSAEMKVWDEKKGWVVGGKHEWWGEVEKLQSGWSRIFGGEWNNVGVEEGAEAVIESEDVWYDALETQPERSDEMRSRYALTSGAQENSSRSPAASNTFRDVVVANFAWLFFENLPRTTAITHKRRIRTNRFRRHRDRDYKLPLPNHHAEEDHSIDAPEVSGNEHHIEHEQGRTPEHGELDTPTTDQLSCDSEGFEDQAQLPSHRLLEGGRAS